MFSLIKSQEQIESFIKGFEQQDFVFKYDGFRVVNKYTIIGRKNIASYDWETTGDTDEPFEGARLIFEKISLSNCEEYVSFLQTTIPNLIKFYGENNVITLINREKQLKLFISDARNVILDFQGDLTAFSAVIAVRNNPQ